MGSGQLQGFDYAVYMRYPAEGVERSIRIKQIVPLTGLNTNNCHSGCGPCTWTTMLSWHDLLWTPELLRGSHVKNNVARPPRLKYRAYIDRLMMKIREHLYTYCWGETGMTFTDSMDGGFEYIRTMLGFDFIPINDGPETTEWGTEISRLKQILIVDKRPVMIKLPGHFCVVEEYWQLELNSQPNQDYMQTNDGIVEYVHNSFFEGYWYFKGLKPNYDDYTVKSIRGDPIVVTVSQDSNNIYDLLYLFWVDDDGYIYYKHSLAAEEHIKGHTKSFHLKINDEKIQTDKQPAITTHKNTIYLAYINSQNKLVLLMKEETGLWEIVPGFPDIQASHLAITGGNENWLTIAYTFQDDMYLIGTNLDIKQPDAWPISLIDLPQKSWVEVPELGTISSDFNIFNIDDHIVIYTQDQTTDSSKLSCVEKRYLNFKNSSLMKPSVEKHSSYNPSFAISNENLFVIYSAKSHGRMVIDIIKNKIAYTVLTFEPNEQSAHLLDSTYSSPSMCMWHLDNGQHPSLVIAWKEYEEGKYTIRMRFPSIDTFENPMDYSGLLE